MAGKIVESVVDAHWRSDSPNYTERVKSGRIQAGRLDLVVCGLVRNCEYQLPNTLATIEGTGALFRNWTSVIFENDSTDRSSLLLHQWSQAHPDFVIDSKVLGERIWPMKRSARRGTAMARYRNHCRNHVLERFSHADLVMVVDMDLVDWSLNGILHSMSYWQDWDAMFSNGVRKDREAWVQYDAWALRKESWEPLSFKSVKNDVYPLTHPPVPVRSAFGGLGLYSMNLYQAAEYGGRDCEHVVFHRNAWEAGFTRLFINPAMKTIVR